MLFALFFQTAISDCSIYTPTYPDVRAICNKLTRELYERPVSGVEYSGLHPAWCVPIACACTQDPDEYVKMDRILEYIGGAPNITVFIERVRLIEAY